MVESNDSAQDDRAIGRRLTAWRKAAGLSQEQAAVLAGLTMITLQRIERGERTIEISTARNLAGLYGRDWRDVTEDQPRAANMRAVAPFHLLVHPSVDVDDEMREEAQKVVDALNEKALRRAAKSSPQRPDAPR